MGYGSAAPLPLTEEARAAHPLCFDTFARQSIGSKRLQEPKNKENLTRSVKQGSKS